jgi:hypothetical protein
MKTKSVLRNSIFFITAMAMFFSAKINAHASPIEEAAYEWMVAFVETPAGERFVSFVGLLGPNAAYIIILSVIILPPIIITQTYGRYLRNKYSFKMFLNWPGIITMGCYGIAAFAVMFQVVDFNLNDPENVKRLPWLLLAIGAPGMIIYFINCMIKTKNIIHALISPLLMYFYYFIYGSIFGSIVLIIFMLYIGLTFAKGGFRGGTCSRCGASVSGIAGTCSNCDASFD